MMPATEGDDSSPEITTEVQRTHEKSCWTVFVGIMFLFCTMVVLMLYEVWDTHGGTIKVHSTEYFILCLMGGVLSGLPHTILTPLDVIKCRMQVGEYSSLADGFRTITRTEGASFDAFYRGWAPTFIGYSLQGALKFGLYEYFKFTLISGTMSHGAVTLVYLFASACAEIIADVALAPWEAVKVKMQTTRKVEPRLSVLMPRMWDSEGAHAFFKGLPPLWARQIPYTMAKFTFFEKIVHFIYAHVLSTADRSLLAPSTQLMVTLSAGYISGIMCAIVSHPADTVITKINQRHDGGFAASLAILRELGCIGLWRGVGVRILMIGTLTGMQWLIYDTFKVMVGFPTTGAVAK